MLGDKVVDTITGNRFVFFTSRYVTQNGSYSDPKCSSYREHFLKNSPGTKLKISIKKTLFRPDTFFKNVRITQDVSQHFSNSTVKINSRTFYFVHSFLTCSNRVQFFLKSILEKYARGQSC